jgi:hypothetical protein
MRYFGRGNRTILFVAAAFTGLMMFSGCSERIEVEKIDEEIYAVGDTVNVSGTLVDTRCLSSNWSNINMDHPDPVPTSQTGEACAIYCARQGFPVGLATGPEPDSTVWMLLSTPQLLSDYMAQTVRIRGVVRSEGILTPVRVEAKKPDGGWTFVI